MRKFQFTLAMVLAGFTSWSQCETNVSASDTLICPGDSVQISAGGPANPLTTTFAAGNNHRGNMFDIVAINNVTIQSFDAHPMGTTDYEIYYKVGTYVGSETNAAAWTLVGSATNIPSQGTGVPTPIPISVGVAIPAGQTYAFYVTSTNTAVSLNYTNGTTAGAVFASDANIQFLEGSGMEYPFANGGSFFTPRVWNGIIHYSTGPVTYSWSTGSTNSSIGVAPLTPTTYYVDITPDGCPTVMDSVTINLSPVPTVDLGPDTTVCPGTQVTIDAGNPGLTYSWNNGFSTNQTIAVLPGTDYHVAVTNSDGCIGYDTIAVIQQTPPAVDLGADLAICDGSTTTLDAGNAGATFSWDTGDMTQTIDVGAGSYSVTVTDGAGCTGSDNITITSNPLPTVNATGDTMICVNYSTVVDAGPGHASYLWSTSETTQTITIDGSTVGTGSHDYTVMVTDSNGCESMGTVTVVIDGCVGIEEIVPSGITAYPNPTTNVVTLELEGWNAATVIIYNTDGKLISEQLMNSNSEQLDFSSYANGTYLLELRSKDRVGTIRVVKN